MPFEPRLLRDDFSSDDSRPIDGGLERELSPDLMELAEQLREESACLAERYPAGGLRECTGSESRGRRTAQWMIGQLRWRSVAAAALVSTTIWALSQHGRVWHDNPPPVNTTFARAPESPEIAPSIHNINSPVPAVFFQELTGPEREGLLDLLEEERLDRSSLSI